MFGYWKKKYEKLLETKIHNEDEYKKIIAKLEAAIPSFNTAQSVSIDFETMKPFSIERVPGNSGRMEHTSIGYFFDNNVREWCLYISRDQHEKLVEEFKTWKAPR